MNVKSIRTVILLSFSIIMFLLSTGSISGEEPKKVPPSAESVKTVNNIVIDTAKKEIRINVRLAILEGILEFFLVDDWAQTYESVFKITNNKASELHFGLLLLGYTPVKFDEYYKILNEKNGLDTLKKKNSVLDIIIKQKDKELPLSSIIRNRETGKEGKDQKLYWVFTGGAFDETNQYAPDITGIYISIWPELAAVINLFSTAGNPYRGEVGYEIAKDIPFTMEDDFILIIRGVK
jgi:hypothetical protein